MNTRNEVPLPSLPDPQVRELIADFRRDVSTVLSLLRERIRTPDADDAAQMQRLALWVARIDRIDALLTRPVPQPDGGLVQLIEKWTERLNRGSSGEDAWAMLDDLRKLAASRPDGEARTIALLRKELDGDAGRCRQLAGMRDWLKDAPHKPGCPKANGWTDIDCDCGLDALRAAPPVDGEARPQEVDTAHLAKAIQKYAEWCGGVHDDGCPEDDTCDCSGKWINDGVTGAVNYLLAASPGDGAAPPPGAE
jgi:hypothetical protein